MPSKVWNAVASAAVGGVVGIGGTVTTGAFGYLDKNRELDIEMVKVELRFWQEKTRTLPCQAENSPSRSTAPDRERSRRRRGPRHRPSKAGDRPMTAHVRTLGPFGMAARMNPRDGASQSRSV